MINLLLEYFKGYFYTKFDLPKITTWKSTAVSNNYITIVLNVLNDFY